MLGQPSTRLAELHQHQLNNLLLQERLLFPLFLLHLLLKVYMSQDRFLCLLLKRSVVLWQELVVNSKGHPFTFKEKRRRLVTRKRLQIISMMLGHKCVLPVILTCASPSLIVLIYPVSVFWEWTLDIVKMLLVQSHSALSE